MTNRRPTRARIDVRPGALLALAFALSTLGGCTDDDPYVPTNNVPIARAAGDALIAVGDPAAMNGNDSRDFDGDALQYNWTVIDGPTGSTAEFERPNARAVTFTPDLLGEYVIRMEVSDGRDASADTLALRAVACKVSPTLLSFGSTPTSGAAVRRSFKVYNRGNFTLNGTLSESCAPFSIVGAVSAFSVAAGDSATYSVDLAPVASAPEGLRCEISTGLADCPTVVAVSLPSGTGSAIAYDDAHAAMRSINCLGCHPADLSTNVDASFQWAIDLVNVSAPESSALLVYPRAGGHSGASQVLSQGLYDPGDPVYEIVLEWIRQGAPR